MRNIIILLMVCISAAAGICTADELVLEDGRILSGNVTDLTEDTVSIVVNGSVIQISRTEVEAVFLGQDNPFSARGYPGVKTTADPQGPEDEK